MDRMSAERSMQVSHTAGKPPPSIKTFAGSEEIKGRVVHPPMKTGSGVNPRKRRSVAGLGFPILDVPDPARLNSKLSVDRSEARTKVRPRGGRKMTTIAIMPESPGRMSTNYRAIAGLKQGPGKLAELQDPLEAGPAMPATHFWTKSRLTGSLGQRRVTKGEHRRARSSQWETDRACSTLVVS
jgi:hypothetical protein